jgi:hypothetical protein
MAKSDAPVPGRHRGDLPPLLYLRPLLVPIADASATGEQLPRFRTDHPYVERCWLPVIGPAATLCLRRLGAELDAHPSGTAIDLAILARDLGLRAHLNATAPLSRSLRRLSDFGLARFAGNDTFEVRTSLPPVSIRSLAGLSRESQAAHRAMVAEASNPLLAAALAYARRGWSVLPLQVAEKTPDGRLVPHGLSDASSDEAVIRQWWAASPRANVGIRTGGGLDVVDLDTPAARVALEALAPNDPLHPSVVVRTARGWHLWFASSGLPTRAGVLDGVDVRGKGGYVVAPPSRHPDGHDYRFLDERTGELTGRMPNVHLTAAPGWLIDRLRPPSRTAPVESTPLRLGSDHYVRVAVESECDAVAATPEGARNHRLNRAAFSLGTLVGAQVLDAEEACTHLLDAALRAGLEEPEALRTIASGLSAGERQPRRRSDGSANPDRTPGSERRRGPVAPEKSADAGRRSADPSRRPDETATAAVLARVRSAASPNTLSPDPRRSSAPRPVIER